MGRDELVDQVTVGRMNFHAVKPGVQGIARRLGVLPDQFFDLQHAQRSRHRRLHQFADPRPGLDKGLGLLGLNSRRCHRCGAVRLQGVVGHTAHMPQLGKDHPAFGMHRVGDLAPAVDLRRGVDARRPGVTLATGFDLRAFADHETGRSALAVILGHQVGGDIAGLGAALACQRWQHDTVVQGVMTQFDRGT